ncbi:MAG: sodium/proline symporter [Lachnospiraceae bacterium]|nr:sodium/proline symporter [Lachnospiraceae bacterium]
MNTITFCIVAAIVVYLLVMLAIGFVFSFKNESSSDFYLGGRKMGPIVTAMSAEASDMSSWLLMGLPGVAYLSGLADAAWTAIGLGVGTYLNWLFVSKRLRRYSSHLNAITVPEFFSKRFNDKKYILSAVAGIVIVIFFIPYTASGFAACGKLFNTLFDVDYTTAMIIAAVIISAYTILGGFKAVCTTDLIQSIVMTIALVVIVVFGISQAGGVDAVIDNAKELPGYLAMSATHNAETGASAPYGFITIISTAAWGLGYFGMPHILLRFMAIKDEKKLVLSRRIATVWVFIAMFVAIFIGIIGSAMTKAGNLENLEDSETIIVKIADIISQNGILAALLAGVILAGILAATMSTADSQMLAAASGISQNVLVEFFGIKLSKKMNVLIARLTILAISTIAVFLALNPESSVFKIVSFAWAGFGGAFGAVVILALFWKRMNLAGAIAGMVSGGAMVFIWKFVVRPLGGSWDIYELLPAFIVSFIISVVVSLLTKAPDKEIVDTFEAVKTGKLEVTE